MPCRAGGPRRWLRSALCRSRGSERTVPPVRTGAGVLLSVPRFWRRPLGLPAGSGVFGARSSSPAEGGGQVPRHRCHTVPAAPLPLSRAVGSKTGRPPGKEGSMFAKRSPSTQRTAVLSWGLRTANSSQPGVPARCRSARGQRGFASAAPPGVMCRKGRQKLVGAAGRKVGFSKVDFGKMFFLLLTLTMMSFLTAFCKLGTITLPLTSEKEGFGQCRVLFK